MIEDIWVAAGVGLFVVALFALALLVPRRARTSRTGDALDAAVIGDVKHRLDEMERKQNQADHDLRNLRQTIVGLATKDSVQGVALQVAEMRGEVKGLVINTAATTRSIERIEDFLMKSTADVIAGAKGVEGRS
jgi:hypothetical protein